MFLMCQRIASGTFCVEKIDMPVLHTDDEIHIKQSFVFTFTICNGIMLFPLVTVLVPPVNPFRIRFEEFYKLLFRIGCNVELDKWR